MNMRKREERRYLEDAIARGDLPWKIEQEREAPDFLVCSGAQRFGLEVVTVYRGAGTLFTDRGGALTKAREAQRNAKIQRLRKNYEGRGGVPLTVRLLGNLQSADLEAIPDLLISASLEELPIGKVFSIDLPSISIRVTRAFSSQWVNLNDMVGWVDTNPQRELESVITAKAGKLADYINNVGPDVRLLIVANGRFNSGKLRPDPTMLFNLRGFAKVYFLDWPGGELQELAG